MEQREHKSLAFSLLKALLSRKVLSPAVYDLMTSIFHLMVKSVDDSLQKECSAVLLQFLLDYPLGKVRLAQHLGFLLNNLNFPVAKGRMQVLSMLIAPPHEHAHMTHALTQMIRSDEI